jgi:hypothetical protein
MSQDDKTPENTGLPHPAGAGLHVDVPPAPETQGELPPTTEDLLEGLDKRDEPKVEMTLREKAAAWWEGKGAPDASTPVLPPGTTPAT